MQGKDKLPCPTDMCSGMLVEARQRRMLANGVAALPQVMLCVPLDQSCPPACIALTTYGTCE